MYHIWFCHFVPSNFIASCSCSSHDSVSIPAAGTSGRKAEWLLKAINTGGFFYLNFVCNFCRLFFFGFLPFCLFSVFFLFPDRTVLPRADPKLNRISWLSSTAMPSIKVIEPDEADCIRPDEMRCAFQRIWFKRPPASNNFNWNASHCLDAGGIYSASIVLVVYLTGIRVSAKPECLSCNLFLRPTDFLLSCSSTNTKLDNCGFLQLFRGW